MKNKHVKFSIATAIISLLLCLALVLGMSLAVGAELQTALGCLALFFGWLSVYAICRLRWGKEDRYTWTRVRSRT